MVSATDEAHALKEFVQNLRNGPRRDGFDPNNPATWPRFGSNVCYDALAAAEVLFYCMLSFVAVFFF